MKKQLSITQYNWLIRLVEKDLAHTAQCHEQEPNRVFAIRIANMEELKNTLADMKAQAIAKESRVQQR